jgi:hypothetical protein
VAENNFLEFPKHGHMGLAVTSGIFYDGEVQYVTGAPNVIVGEEGTGEIHFYQRSVRERTLARRPDRCRIHSVSGQALSSDWSWPERITGC